MVILTATPSQLDNILTLCLVGVLALVVIIAVLRRAFYKPAPTPAITEEALAPPPEAPGSAGQLKLNSVDPKTAAMLMAIVADKLQKPLNELRFISIKEVD